MGRFHSLLTQFLPACPATQNSRKCTCTRLLAHVPLQLLNAGGPHNDGKAKTPEIMPIPSVKRRQSQVPPLVSLLPILPTTPADRRERRSPRWTTDTPASSSSSLAGCLSNLREGGTAADTSVAGLVLARRSSLLGVTLLAAAVLATALALRAGGAVGTGSGGASGSASGALVGVGDDLRGKVEAGKRSRGQSELDEREGKEGGGGEKGGRQRTKRDRKRALTTRGGSQDPRG